jgi:hypothetical protein
MHTRRYLIVLALAVVILFGMAALVRQYVRPIEPPSGDEEIIFGENFLLERPVEHIVVFAENINLPAGSLVREEAALVGENIIVAGRVNGDLTVTGATVLIDESSRIEGDLIVLGEDVTLAGEVAGAVTVTGERLSIAPGARLRGEIASCVENLANGNPAIARISDCSGVDLSRLDMLHGLRENGPLALFPPEALAVAGAASSVVLSFTLAALSVLAVTLFPRQISHIEEALHARPRRLLVHGLMVYALLIGLGAAFVALVANVPEAALFVLPILLLLGLLTLGMTLAGLTTLALMLGDLLARRLGRAAWPPLVTAALGSAAMSILIHLLLFFPFGMLIAVLLMAFLSAVGLGAALDTRLGTRPLGRSTFVQG